MDRYFFQKNNYFLDIENLHMENPYYGYVSGRLAILEKFIMDQSAYKELISSAGVEEMLKLLEDKYGFKAKKSWEDVLNKDWAATYNLVYDLAPKKEIFDIFFLQYSFHNLKVRLKEKFLGHKTGTPFFETAPFISENNYPGLHQLVMNIEENFYKEGRFQDVDCMLDEEYFVLLLEKTEKFKTPLLTSLVKTWIDLANIKLFFRFKMLGKEKNSLSGFLFHGGNYEERFYPDIYSISPDNLKKEIKNNYYADLFFTGIKCLEDLKSMDELEENCDKFTRKRFNETKHIVYGIEPMIRYLLRKENEIKILRMIFIGKENNIAENIIEDKINGYIT
ncbi:MAG: V-type ATPase subunit [bacterium]